ncbi:MAG: AfsR/SARP family transcriptional regulator [Streptosporangiaceae bacterium]|nr:AfsR/SARP family transcriptional regulator [Streptosporangiaceae bacterium]
MRVDVLGPMAVTQSGAFVRLAGQRQRALLAALVLDLGQIVSVPRLVDVVWGDEPPRTARTKLYAHVWALREEFDRVAPGSSSLLTTTTPGYRLASYGVCVDLAEFKGLTARGRQALNRQDAQTAAELFRGALALWRGQPFADVSSAAIRTVADALNERHLQALEASAEADLALDRYETVAADLGELLISHPLRERMRALCMLALYRMGCRADALSHYHTGREATIAELGLEPGPNLRQLQQLVLRDDPVLTTPVAALGLVMATPAAKLHSASTAPSARSHCRPSAPAKC